VTAGQVVFQVSNGNAAALNAAVRINFVVVKGGNPNEDGEGWQRLAR